MRLVQLTLNRYRNLEPATLRPSSGLNVLVGRNAQGKTNLLESIYVCCVGRSHQTPRDRELIRWGEQTAFITADCRHRDGLHRVEVGLSLSGRKSVRINGSPIHRMGELMGHMNAVIFSPAEISLIRDGPSSRRRFLNMALSQIRPSYFFSLQQYHRALSERNALLRAVASGAGGGDTLPVWELQLAKAGASITRDRLDFGFRLARYAAAIHESLSGGETFSVQYRPAVEAEAGEMESALAELFEKNRDNDIRRLNTMAGPHRDEVALLLDGADVRSYGSQGQKRTCALSLKLAEREIMREDTGEEPLLLLDDVLSELDQSRRRMLLMRIEGTQAFLTGADSERIPSLLQPDFCLYEIEAGRVRAVSGEDKTAQDGSRDDSDFLS